MLIIGIDLGTSKTLATVWRDGKPVIIPGQEVGSGGDRVPGFSSCVALTAGGGLLVGEAARRQVASNPEGTVAAFKRRLGRRENVPLRYGRFSPEQLSAFLLRKIKHQAEAFLGEAVNRAVVTVPACFDDNQRAATIAACRIAGLEVLRLINEPTAAALAYGLDRPGGEGRIAVVDFGGGSLDVSILEFANGVLEVKASSGDSRLGGVDMDQCLFEHLAGRFYEQSGIDVRGDKAAAARLLDAAEMARIELTSSTTTHLNLPFVAMAGGQQRHLHLDLSRQELERVVRPVIDRCRAPVEQVMRDAHVAPGEIDRLILVGGVTRMPVVHGFFEKLFGRPAESGVDPLRSVACGAAIQIGMIAGEAGDIVLVDVTPLTLCIERADGMALPLIARNTPVPVRRRETFTTTANLQSRISFQVFQGERLMVRDNTRLGEFNLDGLPPAPGGVPKIEVMFEIDASGVLDMTARDVASGNAQSIKAGASAHLSAAEKKRMIREIEKYVEVEKKRRGRAQKQVKPGRPPARPPAMEGFT